ncbi:MAG: hypothetical protein PVI92_14275 [Chromatiales bacterium]
MADFITANSVLTPAVVGTGVTTITAILVSQFGLPGNWSALALSMIFGLLTWADKTVPWLKRLALYLINSLTILVFAIRLNEAGMATTGYDDCPVKRIYDRVPDTRPREFFKPWF